MESDPQLDLERKSSAITLSDMELFAFPELTYSLVLANIMSPRIWHWREDPWFHGITAMNPQRRILRVKQYIMDHYAFNLDLDTWGLTTKPRELARFRDVVDAYALKRSNALFGHEGEQHYFDMDIRRNFGLDQYDDGVIPYWKSEIVETMDGFRFKPTFETGAGECLSFAALYAAALFIVARIPLEDVYVLCTPLHAHAFIDVEDGVLTNNRRILTKSMWFNGSALSAKARRALEHEHVTLVSHESGYVHTLFRDATMDHEAYHGFCEKLGAFCRTDLTESILGDFLRQAPHLQPSFQYRWVFRDRECYIGAERIFAYEHDTSYRFTDETREKLLGEIDVDEFHRRPMAKRLVMNDLEGYIREQQINLWNPSQIGRLKSEFETDCRETPLALDSLHSFCNVEPKLPPGQEKLFVKRKKPLGLTTEMDRAAVFERLAAIREQNSMVDLAFYTYRDMSMTEVGPFLHAALERNPVSLTAMREIDTFEVFAQMESLESESIFEEPARLAQPDEVWNFGRGDGVEKALFLANILRDRMPDKEIVIEVSPDQAVVKMAAEEFTFASKKGLEQQVWDLE